MTAHAPAIPRRLIDIGEWLRARRKQKAGPPDDVIALHLHHRPLVILKTTAGDHPALLDGSCLFEDMLMLRYSFMPPADLTVLSVLWRHGTRERVLPLHELTKTVTLRAGMPTRISVGVSFLTITLGMEGDTE